MAKPDIIEEVLKLSKKGKSTQQIRTLLDKKYDRTEVDNAIKFYIDNYVAEEVKEDLNNKPSDAMPPERGRVATFFLGLLFFRGVLPPIIVFIVVLFFAAKFGLPILFREDVTPAMFYFTLILAFILYFVQSGVVYLLVTVFKGEEMINNTFSKSLLLNIFPIVIGAYTMGYFLFTYSKVSVVFMIAAPVAYIMLLSTIYSLSVLRCFFLGVLLTVMNNLLTVLMLFTVGTIFLDVNIFSFSVS